MFLITQEIGLSHLLLHTMLLTTYNMFGTWCHGSGQHRFSTYINYHTIIRYLGRRFGCLLPLWKSNE